MGEENQDKHFEAYENHRNSYALEKIALLKKNVADEK